MKMKTFVRNILILGGWCFAEAALALATLPQGRRDVTSTSKAGLAWANGPSDDITQYLPTGKVSWYYTWSPIALNENGDGDLEFVPQLWGSNQAQDFSTTINSTIRQNKVTAVLGFNEPQETAQANLSPQDGASLWIEHIEPLKAQGIRLGTPAPSSNPNGKVWIQQWLSACNGSCNPDFVALHYYDTNATSFQAYLEDFHSTFNLPIWVTEWADNNFNGGAQPSPNDVVSFLNQTQTFMDATDWVERYAWFGVMQDLQGVDTDNAMMDSKGKITDLGKQYIGALSASDDSDPSASSSSMRNSRIPIPISLFAVIAINVLGVVLGLSALR